ncbi:hypothetical protein D3C81_1727620 [compost metagenome]
MRIAWISSEEVLTANLRNSWATASGCCAAQAWACRMAWVRAAATGFSLRTRLPLTPTTQQLMLAYSSIMLVATSRLPGWLRRRYIIGSEPLAAWISPFSSAVPSRSTG